MNWFRNLAIAKKISGLVGISILFLAAVGFTGYYYLAKASEDMSQMYNERLIPVSLLQENRAHIRAAQAALLELMITRDQKVNERLKVDIEKRAEEFNENMLKLSKSNLDAESTVSLKELQSHMAEYRLHRQKLLALAMENKNEEAYQLYLLDLVPVFNKANSLLVQLAERYEKTADEANKTTQANFQFAVYKMIGIIIASLLVVTGLGIFIGRAIVVPLRAVAVAVTDVASGNLAINRLAIHSSDETGMVAQAIDQMVEKLRQLIMKVADSAEQVAAASEELTAGAQQAAASSQQIASAIDEVAKGAENQLKAVGAGTASVEQMAAGSQQIAVNATVVSDTSGRTADAANSGSKQIASAVTQMANIEKTASESTQVVLQLGEKSKEIGEFISTISTIAAQTNLLALNAAVEAARAGDHGRGFAVVAEEVRKLAEQAQEASKQIGKIVRDIQGGMEKTVTVINEGTREAKRGSDLINIAGQAFDEILTSVGLVDKQTREISAAIQQVAGGSQQIVASMKEIDSHSKTATGQAQNVAAATQQQSAAIEEIAASSQSLARMAQDLQLSVAVFRV